MREADGPPRATKHLRSSRFRRLGSARPPHRLTRCSRAECADIGRSRWAIAARAKAAARGAVAEHSTCEGGSRCQRAQPTIRIDSGSRTALSASRERRGVSLSSPSCSTTSITNSVVGSCTDHEAPTILSAVVCGRQRACYDRTAQWRWSQRRAERAGRRFVTRSCVERCYGRLSGGVLCDVPSVAVSGETSATSVDMEGTYVPRVTVAQKC